MNHVSLSRSLYQTERERASSSLQESSIKRIDEGKKPDAYLGKDNF